MSRNREQNKGYRVLDKAVAVTLAGMLAAGAVLFGANRKHDGDAEAALQHALRPTLERTAKDIIGFADGHPGLVRKRVGRHVVDLSVAGNIKPGSPAGNEQTDAAGMEVVTRRDGDSTEPDPDAVLAVHVQRSGHLRGDNSQTYEEEATIVAPGGTAATLTAGSANLVTTGWAGEEKELTGSTGTSANTITAHDPLKAALTVAEETPGILDQVAADLQYAEHSGEEPPRLMP